jgi:hypothetical protein
VLVMTIKGADELRDLARDLRRAKGTLRSELTKAFKAAGAPTLKDVKRNMTTMDIRGFRTGKKPTFTAAMPAKGLRRRIAAVTELDISTSFAGPRVRFVVRTDRLGSAQSLPWHLDSAKKFRHPIMGRRGRWAASLGKPWFYQTIRDDLPRFEAECDKAIDRTVAAIERG